MSDSDLYRKALVFAAKAHNFQKMPSLELPYFLHISEVMTETLLACQKSNISEEKTNLAVLVAILHDTVEDTATVLEDIENHFGKAVKEGVWAGTKDESLPKEEQMKDSLQKIREQPKEVWMVKLADRIVNLKAPPSYWTREKKVFYYREARFILEQLGEANDYLAKRLEQKIKDYEQFFEA